jgi:hypothetical protein
MGAPQTRGTRSSRSSAVPGPDAETISSTPNGPDETRMKTTRKTVPTERRVVLSGASMTDLGRRRCVRAAAPP